ncbi:MAG: hypothetical protein ACOY3O_14630 [Thermodesulfobacteriota bacterium]
MASQPTLEDIMASEIKRDIAMRYFGFRKLIEEDGLALSEKTRQYSYILQKRISFDLIRIYVLLRDEELITSFLDLIGLHKELFYDPYLSQSFNIIKRVLACQHFHGMFRSSRFTNYILDCYENLTMHAELYRQRVRELQDDRAFIAEEIKEFYRENDLNVILHFLQSMEDPKATGSMQGGMEIGLAEGLEQKLHLTPPRPIEQTMTILPPLQPLPTIKRPLKKLAKQAYKIQPPEILALFARKETGCDREGSADPAF